MKKFLIRIEMVGASNGPKAEFNKGVLPASSFQSDY